MRSYADAIVVEDQKTTFPLVNAAVQAPVWCQLIGLCAEDVSSLYLCSCRKLPSSVKKRKHVRLQRRFWIYIADRKK
ncbi:hypothetical protein AGOR_G00128420 [Albula goreensis]|uniref:Uncharacterized protein n=1 Tax=Albula goreensis TaxID=1534307 RepID=A0A8T3DAY1_9TELE|nr:hypothetical protein AGOR_G00128420 [Albula goreensis]